MKIDISGSCKKCICMQCMLAERVILLLHKKLFTSKWKRVSLLTAVMGRAVLPPWKLLLCLLSLSFPPSLSSPPSLPPSPWDFLADRRGCEVWMVQLRLWCCHFPSTQRVQGHQALANERDSGAGKMYQVAKPGASYPSPCPLLHRLSCRAMAWRDQSCAPLQSMDL